MSLQDVDSSPPALHVQRCGIKVQEEHSASHHSKVPDATFRLR